MSKLLENTFRSVNIALVNEMALLCDRLGIDVWEVIDAAATKPFGFMPFYPGPGLGGHCIPVDPFYLAWKARERGFDARFIELAGQVNAYMPFYVVSKVADALNRSRKALRGSRILVLGVAYKAETDDVRESPALDVIALLREKGAEIAFHDPFVPAVGAPLEQRSVPLTEESVRACDCAVIVTGHRGVDYDLVVRCAPAIVDTRNVLKGRAEDHIVRI
jgi:UDP-N-acetyl-D-glucosamine dehydrogenase